MRFVCPCLQAAEEGENQAAAAPSAGRVIEIEDESEEEEEGGDDAEDVADTEEKGV